MQVHRHLTDEQKAARVGVSANTVRRWRRQAGAGGPVPIGDVAYETMLEQLDALPPADAEGYEQGVRAAIRAAKVALDGVEARLLGERSGAAAISDVSAEAAVEAARIVKAADRRKRRASNE